MTKALIFSVLFLLCGYTAEIQARTKISGGPGTSGTPASGNHKLIAKEVTEQPGFASENERSLVRIVAGYSGDSLSFDPLVIYDEPQATSEFDGKYDALKLLNTDAAVTNFYSFSASGRQLSINGLPIGESSFSVRLGLKTDRTGNVVIKIRDISGELSSMKINLYDSENNSETDLLTSSYQLSLEAGVYDDRFILNFSAPLVLSDDGPVPGMAGSTFSIYTYHGVIRTSIGEFISCPGHLYIHDLKGSLVYTSEIAAPGIIDLPLSPGSGIYIATFVNRTARYTAKLVLMK